MPNQTFPLAAQESEELTQLEARIKSGLSSFLEVGEALAAIRDGKLYRASHATFEDYCRDKWGMSRGYAHRLINSAEVVEMLPIGNKSEVTNEAQVRELAKVESKERPAIIEKAKEIAAGETITAADLKAAAGASTPVAPQKPAEATEQPATWSLPRWGDKMRSCFATLINAVPAEYRAEAKSHAAKIAAEVFAPSEADPKPEPWGPRNVIPPMPEWVTAYSASIGYPMNGEAWCDGYAQKGWMVGKVKMKDWQAAVRNWKMNGWVPGDGASQPKVKPIMR